MGLRRRSLTQVFKCQTRVNFSVDALAAKASTLKPQQMSGGRKRPAIPKRKNLPA